MYKSFEYFVEELIEKFSYDDFAPDKVSKLPERFREIFYNDTAYWMKSDADLKIEFKKYGDNRKNIELCY